MASVAALLSLCVGALPLCSNNENVNSVVNLQSNVGDFNPTDPLTFGGPLSVKATVTIENPTWWRRIFDFGNSRAADNVFVGLRDNTRRLALSVYRNDTWQELVCQLDVPLGTPFTVEARVTRDASAVTQGVGSIYLDGELCAAGDLHLPRMVERSSNYIGRSNWAEDADLDGRVHSLAISSCVPQMPCVTMQEVVNDDSGAMLNEQPKVTFGGAMYVRATVTIKNPTWWGRIFDFGKGRAADNFIVGLRDRTRRITMRVYRYGMWQELVCQLDVPLGTPVTVEAQISHNTSAETQGVGSIYLDGELCAAGSVHLPRMVERGSNYIGRSNWVEDADLDGMVHSLAISSCALRKPCANMQQVVQADSIITFSQQPSMTFGGAMYVRAAVTFGIPTLWACIFDFGNGAEKDNVLLSLADNTKQLVLEVWRGKVAQTLRCTSDVPMSTTFTVEATIRRNSESAVTGLGTIYIDGVECVKGPLHLPEVVERSSNLIKRSSWAADPDLAGTVNSFELSTCPTM